MTLSHQLWDGCESLRPVSEEEFDAGFERIQRAGITCCADPHLRQEGRINHNDGGRGVYFRDPAGHGMEIMTRPYGG